MALPRDLSAAGEFLFPLIATGADLFDQFGPEGRQAAARETNRRFEQGADVLQGVARGAEDKRTGLANFSFQGNQGTIGGFGRESRGDLQAFSNRFFRPTTAQGQAASGGFADARAGIASNVQQITGKLDELQVAAQGGRKLLPSEIQLVKDLNKELKSLDTQQKELDAQERAQPSEGRFTALNKETDPARVAALEGDISTFTADVDATVRTMMAEVNTAFDTITGRVDAALSLATGNKAEALNNVTKDYGLATMQALAGARQQEQAALDNLDATWKGPRDNRYQDARRNIRQQFSEVAGVTAQTAAANYGRIRSQVELGHNTSINSLNSTLESAVAGVAGQVIGASVAGAGLKAGAADVAVRLRDASGRLTQAGATAALEADEGVRTALFNARANLRETVKNDDLQNQALFTTLMSNAFTRGEDMNAQFAGALMNWTITLAPLAPTFWNLTSANENIIDREITRDERRAQENAANNALIGSLGGSLIQATGDLARGGF